MESILFKDLTDYMIYEFESNFETDQADNDIMQAITTALQIILGKYHHITGNELEHYVNNRVLRLLEKGYRPKAFVSSDLVDLFMETLRAKNVAYC